MPKGPVETVFEDYVGDAVPNLGKKGDGAKYDTYSGVAPGDTATPGVLGDLLTEVSAPTSDGGSEVY